MKSNLTVTGFVPLVVYMAVVKERVAARERVLCVSTAVLYVNRQNGSFVIPLQAALVLGEKVLPGYGNVIGEKAG
jgi:hypothetical protein